MLHGASWRCESGSLLTGGFTFTWEWSNFPDSLSGNSEQIVRSFYYAGAATLLALLIAYPLAYAIAQQSGRWRLLLLFAVIAPVLHHLPDPHDRLEDDPRRPSPVVDVLQTLHLLPQDGRVLATSAAVIAGLTYNFLPFMILPIYASLERLDLRLIEAAKDLYSSSTPGLPAGDAAADRAGDRRRRPAHLHPRLRRLRQRPPSSAGRTRR